MVKAWMRCNVIPSKSSRLGYTLLTFLTACQTYPRLFRFRGSSLYFPSLAHPIDPAARVLGYVRPAGVPRKPGRSSAPHTGLAVKDHLGILSRRGESESVFKVLGFDVETIGRRRDGDIDRARDPARLLKLAWFARVCRSRNKKRRASQRPQDRIRPGVGRRRGIKLVGTYR